MHRPGFKPENVTRQMKCADLTPSVGQQFVAANRAADDLVNVFRGLILSVDFLVLFVGEFSGDEAGVPGDRAKLVESGDGVGNGANLVAN
jgi:hypothetical protein